MTFVNEYISDADRKKYGIDAIDADLDRRAQVRSRDWTIDHEREIYFRFINRGREESRNLSAWDFYWQGELMTVWLLRLDAGGVRGGHGWSRYKLDKTEGDFVPPHLQAQWDEVMADLRAAMLAKKDGGVRSTTTTYAMTLVE